MNAITFMHIGAACAFIGLLLLAYGLFSDCDRPPLIRPGNVLTWAALTACALSSTCLLIIYGGWIIA
jgi:hypothetical protein